ncbi:MAG: class I SAM-dependent methyltransferase [Candidatus Zambryskibacteria bacterium]|nr:class I SAM-dependent methyltransferase [Candidatus Zambryskibacteria bacterium]
MDKSFTKKLYEEHHAKRRAPGFSILKEERGNLFASVIGKDKNVLDIGCRDGALTKFFIEGNNVTGGDVDAIALRKAGELGIEAIEMDLYGDWEELEGRKFDVIVAGEVLEHLFFPEKIVEKVRDHLNSDGVFVGSVPNAFSFKNRIKYLFGVKKNTPLSDPTHINHFSRGEIMELLSRYFTSVYALPLGRFSVLDKFWPGMFSFDLVFVCKNNFKAK